MNSTLKSGILAGLLTLTAPALGGPEADRVKPGDDAFIGPVLTTPEPRREVKGPEVKAPVVKTPEVHTPARTPDPKTDTKPDSKPDSKADTKPETRPEFRSEPLADAKPEPLAPRKAPAHDESAPLGKPAVKAEGPAPVAPTGGVGMTRTILALAAVLALIVLVAGIFRKVAARTGGLAAAMGVAGKAPSGILSILGRYPLDRNTTLVLLKVDRRVLLLAQTRGGARLAASGLTTLCEITGAEDVASIMGKSAAADGGSPALKFQRALEQADESEEADEALEHGPAARPAGAEALAAVIQAALQQGRQAVAARAEAKPVARPAAKAATSDAAAELRKRLAAMRAKAALEVSGKARTEVIA